MNAGLYICCFGALAFVLLWNRRTRLMRILTDDEPMREGKRQMKTMARRLIGKDVIAYTYDSQIKGTLLDVSDEALLLGGEGGEQVVNLRYVVRLREHPLDQKGRKKSVVLD